MQINMARIVNIIKDPHFCSWKEESEGASHLESTVFKYRAFVEDDEGEVCSCHLMNDMDFIDGLDAAHLLKEEKNTPITEEDAYSLHETRLLELVKGNCMEDCSPTISVIETLLDEMEEGGIDLKVVLLRLLRDIYEKRYIR